MNYTQRDPNLPAPWRLAAPAAHHRYQTRIFSTGTEDRLSLQALARQAYALTDEGIRVAVFYTKLRKHLLRPPFDADKPPAPTEVRRALATLHAAVNQFVNDARLAPAS